MPVGHHLRPVRPKLAGQLAGRDLNLRRNRPVVRFQPFRPLAELSPPIFFYFCVSISFEIDAQGWMVVLFCRQLILDFFVLAAHDPIPNQTNMKKKRDDRRLVFEFLLRRRTQKKKKKKKTKLFLSVKKDEDTDRMEGEE
jgi:hypothetical protein